MYINALTILNLMTAAPLFDYNTPPPSNAHRSFVEGILPCVLSWLFCKAVFCRVYRLRCGYLQEKYETGLLSVNTRLDHSRVFGAALDILPNHTGIFTTHFGMVYTVCQPKAPHLPGASYNTPSGYTLFCTCTHTRLRRFRFIVLVTTVFCLSGGRKTCTDSRKFAF